MSSIAKGVANRIAAPIGKSIVGTELNQIDEALLADNTYLVTEEGYLIVEEDNKENIFIQED